MENENKKEKFNTVLASKMQEQYCKKNNYIQFAPRNGICYRCGKNIYDKIEVERAGKFLITGCPHCNYSFCE